jgi:hypothetical protein
MPRARLRFFVTVLGGVLALCSLLTGTAAAQPGPATAAPAAATEQDLGGQTLTEYCQAQGYVQATQHSNFWTCDAPGVSAPLSLTAECQWQFADMVAAGFTIYSVNGHCKTLASSTNRISDLNAIGQYCQSLGYTQATADAAGVPRNNVASWRCVDNSNGNDGVEYKIDLHAACRWVNGGYVQAGIMVVSYFPNYGAYLEITCIDVLR